MRTKQTIWACGSPNENRRSAAQVRNLNGGCPPWNIPGRQTQVTVVCVTGGVYGTWFTAVNDIPLGIVAPCSPISSRAACHCVPVSKTLLGTFCTLNITRHPIPPARQHHQMGFDLEDLLMSTPSDVVVCEGGRQRREFN